jgi:hypothetical protein
MNVTHVSTSAAYVRKNPAPDARAMQAAGLHGSNFEETIWELLATPQTLESLHRAAHGETQGDRVQIKRALERLLDADLIELSPDS